MGPGAHLSAAPWARPHCPQSRKSSAQQLGLAAQGSCALLCISHLAIVPRIPEQTIVTEVISILFVERLLLLVNCQTRQRPQIIQTWPSCQSSFFVLTLIRVVSTLAIAWGRLPIFAESA